MSNTESGREPVILVEIDQKICVNVWGVAPCTATLSNAVPHKCFNTRRTCQDDANFDLAIIPLTLRFCRSMEVVPRAWGAIPCLESSDTTPTQINPGGGSKNSGPLGARATVTLKFRDLPSADFQVDPYQSERFSGVAQFSGVGYSPLERGTFWTKWLRRNPYFEGFPIRILEGYIEEDPATMVTRNYIIEDISGPGTDGMVAIKAQDIIGFSDNDKATCPALSRGKLQYGISTIGYYQNLRVNAPVSTEWTVHPTTFIYYFVGIVLSFKPVSVLVNGTAYPEVAWGAMAPGKWCWTDQDAIGYDTVYIRLNSGDDPDVKAIGYVTAQYTTLIPLTAWVAGEYPAAGGTVRIGDECMTYTAATEAGLICTLSGVVRGTDGTTAEDHSTEDLVQLCYRVADADDVYCWEVVRDLFEIYADIPTTYIPFAAWVAEGTTWIPAFTVTALITEPTGVNQLVGELCQQCLFDIWWDERAQEIKFRALRLPSEIPVEINDRQHIIAGSWSIKSDMKQRVSQIWVWYRPKDPTKKLDETTNYSRVHIIDAPDLESANKYGTPAIKTIYSRWLESSVQCILLNNRYLARFQDGTKYLKIKMDAKDRILWTGEVVAVTLHGIVDAVGVPEQKLWQVISAEEVVPGEIVEYNLQSYLVGSNKYGYYEDAIAPHAGYWADINGLLADGSDGYSYQ